LVGHSTLLRNDLPEVASLSPDGSVHALTSGAGRQTCVRGEFDGTPATNWCCVRVLGYPASLLPEEVVRSGRVAFWFPPMSMTPAPAGCRFQEMTQHYDYVHTLDVASVRMAELTGTHSAEGGTQHVAAVCEDDVFKLGGGSGHPVGLGFDPRIPSGCVQQANGVPQWGVVLHEIGHNFVGGCVSLKRILCEGTLTSGFAYSEGLATLCNMYSRQAIVARSDHDGLLPAVIDSWTDPSVCDSLPFHRRVFVDDRLTSYVQQGAHYPTGFTADVLDGMFIVLAEQYGWDIYPRFFSVFWPPDEEIGFAPSDETQRATFFVAAMSAAARADLRPVFRRWGFPCDDAIFNCWFPTLQWRALQSRGGPNFSL